MKRFLLTAAIIAGTVFSAAAQVRTAYFVESYTLRSRFNPAFAPTQGYVNFPMLGSLNFNLDGTLSVNDIIKQRSDGRLATILSSAISSKEAFSGLNKNNNSFNFNTDINIISFGSYLKNHKSFWSFDMNLHADTALDIPFSFFEFAKNISGESNRYDFSKMQLFAQSYIDFGFNYSMPIMENLYVGARVKFIVGLAQADAKLSSFDLSLTENEWSANMQAEMNMRLNGASAPVGGKFNDMDFNVKGPAGYGFGLDLGATYSPIKNLTVSLAVNDIGFIRWNNSVQYATNEKGISFSGMDMTIGKETTTENIGDGLSFDDIGLVCTGSGNAKTTALRATINAGAEYEMWNHWVGFGLLYHARMGLYKSSHNITASVNFHPRYWFTLSPSYTFNNNRGGALGLALNFAPRGFNFFLATDVLLSKLAKSYYIPYKQDRMTFTFGLGFNIGKRGYRIAEYAEKWQAKANAKAKASRTSSTVVRVN